ncbi:hypothetical protein CQA53_06800 [Helicobacter didelphidarum]|uniref:Type I restriction enzyme endonuclease subunit n=1 Tax=Helicobacter didelphidarum TaxID=2040648 RepID=A0A3D8IK70_9HELI|nr:type I restriction endonuclease subunit R [Helicobacter didelphidarum]RDU65276.1 hypothetical protein CQA53_06800 [Helicobacter didelphidarum]
MNPDSHKLDESTLESYALETLREVGYACHNASMIPRKSDEWVLDGKLRDSMMRLNADDSVFKSLPHTRQEELIDEVIKKLKALESHNLADTLIDTNATMHEMLIEGVSVEVALDGTMRSTRLALIDFDNPANNDFLALNQLHFHSKQHTLSKRPDVVLFVNGLPLVIIEFKNPLAPNATIESAFHQLQTYKAFISELFIPNALCVISDGLSAKAGSLSADYSRFMVWKNPDSKPCKYLVGESTRANPHSMDCHDLTSSNLTLTPPQNPNVSHDMNDTFTNPTFTPQIEVLIRYLLNPATLLDMLRYFTLFERVEQRDARGIIEAKTIKKIAAYHQYYAVNKAIERTAQAMSGDKKGGSVWHTQGSGKSLSMVFYTAKAVARFHNPTILLITDRNDLDGQLFSTFALACKLLRTTPEQATSTQDLKAKLKVASGGIVFSTIQKFRADENSERFELLSTRDNIIVLCDEAHRTQYGFEARIAGEDLRYGYAKYLRDALPNATYLGFTGTPIEKIDADTRRVFGEYIDIYDIARAIEDGATLKIYYESALIKLSVSDEGKRLIEELDSQMIESESQEKIKAKATKLQALVGAKERLKIVAQNILRHFYARQEIFKGKAMIVCMSREIAVNLYDEMIALEPSLHSERLESGKLKVIITADSKDGANLAKHHTSKKERDNLATRFKNINDELEMVIVCDMWLTGFDAPPLHTLYIDKLMQGHNLMQAIARVNRVYQDKPAGLIVDFIGIANELKRALEFYTSNGGSGVLLEQKEQIIDKMQEKLEVVAQMFKKCEYLRYFKLDSTKAKLEFLNEAMEIILTNENGKKRFLDEYNHLSKAYVMSLPSEEARSIAKHIAFFEALKAVFLKLESREQREQNLISQSVIKQILDSAVESENIVDILETNGIKAQNISILDDEFLDEVRGLKKSHIAVELLKKLLNDELRARAKTNLIQNKSLMQRFNEIMRKYQNKLIGTLEVIEELITLSKELITQDKERIESGLSDYEFAFYSAVCENKSANELLGREKLRELAIAIYYQVKENASIDWHKKESARAKLRLAVKKCLKQYGYPPDMEQLAIDNVIKQAELMAENEIN